ncbi:hypothetical protein SLA2020_317450 [Shorea laevis]
MNMGTEGINEGGAIETKVETVDYKSLPGKEHEEPRKEKVGVVHLTHERGKSATTAGGVLAGPADAAAKALKSAKDAISGSSHDSNK